MASRREPQAEDEEAARVRMIGSQLDRDRQEEERSGMRRGSSQSSSEADQLRRQHQGGHEQQRPWDGNWMSAEAEVKKIREGRTSRASEDRYGEEEYWIRA